MKSPFHWFHWQSAHIMAGGLCPTGQVNLGYWIAMGRFWANFPTDFVNANQLLCSDHAEQPMFSTDRKPPIVNAVMALNRGQLALFSNQTFIQISISVGQCPQWCYVKSYPIQTFWLLLFCYFFPSWTWSNVPFAVSPWSALTLEAQISTGVMYLNFLLSVLHIGWYYLQQTIAVYCFLTYLSYGKISGNTQMLLRYKKVPERLGSIHLSILQVTTFGIL